MSRPEDFPVTRVEFEQVRELALLTAKRDGHYPDCAVMTLHDGREGKDQPCTCGFRRIHDQVRRVFDTIPTDGGHPCPSCGQLTYRPLSPRRDYVSEVVLAFLWVTFPDRVIRLDHDRVITCDGVRLLMLPSNRADGQPEDLPTLRYMFQDWAERVRAVPR